MKRISLLLTLLLFLGISPSIGQSDVFLERLTANRDLEFHWNYFYKTDFSKKDKSNTPVKEFSHWFSAKSITKAFNEKVYDDDRWLTKDSLSTQTKFVHVNISQLDIYSNTNRLSDGIPDAYRLSYEIVVTDFKGDTILENDTNEVEKDISAYLSLDFYSFNTESVREFFKNIHEEIARNLNKSVIKQTDSLELDSIPILPELLPIQQNSKAKDGIAINHHTIAIQAGNYFLAGLYLGDGYALTDARVFRSNDTERNAFTSIQDTFEIELVRQNKLYNLALVKLKSDRPFVSEKLTLGKDYNLLDEIHSYGTTGELYYFNTLSKGSISGKTEIYDQQYFLTDSPSHIAFTGSGVFNSKNECLGISIMSDYDHRANLIMPCLEANQIENILNIKL